MVFILCIKHVLPIVWYECEPLLLTVKAEDGVVRKMFGLKKEAGTGG